MKEKVSFDELTIKKAIEIDLLFQKCAKLARKEMPEWDYGSRKTKKWLEPNSKWLRQCYDNTRFGVNIISSCTDEERIQYKERVWASFVVCMGNIDEHVDKRWLALMTPVLFYVLIINHEFNEGAVYKRLERFQKDSKSTSRKNNMTVDGWGKINPKEITRSVAYDRHSKHSYADKLKNAIDTANAQWGDVAEYDGDVVHGAELTKVFKPDHACNYILYRQESASIGLFLRDILSLDKITQRNVHPIDTLLRLYIINSYDNIFSRTSIFRSNDVNLFGDEAQNMLLTKAVDILRPKAQVMAEAKSTVELQKIVCQTLLRMDEEKQKNPKKSWTLPQLYKTVISERRETHFDNHVIPQLLSLDEDCAKPTGTFLEAYTELINRFEIDPSLINTLSELYLNETVLNENIDFKNLVKKYMEEVREYLKQPKNNAPSCDGTELHQLNMVCWELLYDKIDDFLIDLQRWLYLKFKGRKIRLSKSKGPKRYVKKKESESFSWLSKSCQFCLLDRVCFDCNLRAETTNKRFPCVYDMALSKRISSRK